MTLESIFEQLGGDYHETKERLMSDELILRMLKKFSADQEYSKLEQAMKAKDLETAFRAAHTLKGIALNLGLGNLAKSAVDLTESLRYGKTDFTEELFEQCKEEYRKTISILEQLK
ncbi:MAG: Hpt domain-containing protein [Eubacteriales bacterium]|nr:Hpt domain-containing protein [Eubacteriales bacterium]